MSVPRKLSAKFKEDFAYPTIKDRIPVILTKVVDHVYRMKAEVAETIGETGIADLKSICGACSKLRNEIQTNKPLTELDDDLEDVEEWNAYLEQDTRCNQVSCWFGSPWLYTECYFYRRVQQGIRHSSVLKDLDPFQVLKQQAFHDSVNATDSLGQCLLDTVQDVDHSQQKVENYFKQFLQVSLWGNKCDLSISAGSTNTQKVDLVSQLDKLTSYILCDDTSQVWQQLQQAKDRGSGRVDIVLDNAGFELITDLCLSDFLLSSGYCREIHLHIKNMPWFVSDVTEEDFNWTLCQMAQCDSTAQKTLAQRWNKYLEKGAMKLRKHHFWTLPHDFSLMKVTSPDLYHDLAKSDLLFFKGDLNYRKLTGDLAWPSMTPFQESLRQFHPAPLCTLRTLKSDLVVGLGPGVAERTESADDRWMLTGTWAVIQSCSTKC